MPAFLTERKPAIFDKQCQLSGNLGKYFLNTTHISLRFLKQYCLLYRSGWQCLNKNIQKPHCYLNKPAAACAAAQITAETTASKIAYFRQCESVAGSPVAVWPSRNFISRNRTIIMAGTTHQKIISEIRVELAFSHENVGSAYHQSEVA